MSRRPRGQILVELGLALGFVIIPLILVATEIGYLLPAMAHQDRATSVVAEYAAEHPDDESWRAVAERELPGCDVTKTEPLPDLVEIGATCHYSMKILVDLPGLPMSSRETAAIRSGPAPVSPASPSPSAAGFVS